MNKKILIMIAVITAAISCLWFFLKPAEKDPTLVTLYGNVDIRQFDIGFQVPGQITKMYFEEGDTVQEGTRRLISTASSTVKWEMCFS